MLVSALIKKTNKLRTNNKVQQTKKVLNTKQQKRLFNKSIVAKAEYDGWPEDLKKAAIEWDALREKEKKEAIVFPKIENAPTGPYGQVALRIFNYAWALKWNLDTLRTELSDIVEQASKDEQVNELLFNPNSNWDAQEYESVFLEALDELPVSSQTKEMLAFLFHLNEISKVPRAVPLLNNVIRAYKNEHAAILTTATSLSADELEFYKKSFTSQLFGEQASLELNHVVDPSIEGGYILQVDGDSKIDRSLRSQLQAVREEEQDASEKWRSSIRSQSVPSIFSFEVPKAGEAKH